MYSGDSQINTSLDTGITSEQEESEWKTPFRCEIKRAINSLKDRKSLGCDNIHAEMIKACRNEGVDSINYVEKYGKANNGPWIGKEQFL